MAAPTHEKGGIVRDANNRPVDIVAGDWFGRVAGAPVVRVSTPDGKTHPVGAEHPEH